MDRTILYLCDSFLQFEPLEKLAAHYLLAINQRPKAIQIIRDTQGKLPGLVVNVEDSQSEQWSLDVSSIPGFAYELDG
jgi:hypothetical protein